MKITLYTDRIYDSHMEITDPKQAAKLIKETISHLGKFNIYYEKPKSKFQRIINQLFWLQQ